MNRVREVQTRWNAPKRAGGNSESEGGVLTEMAFIVSIVLCLPVSFSLLIMACEGFPGEILGRKFKMKKQFFLNRNDVIGCGVVGTDLYVKV